MRDLPRIPKELHDFLRPKERRLDLGIDNNWGDVNPYEITTILREYGSHVQLGKVEEKHLASQKGNFFPNYIMFSDFVTIRYGWKNILPKLIPLKMKNCRARNHDPEGFIVALKVRIRGGRFWHNFNFLEDVIRNIFDLHKEENRKVKWLDFAKLEKAKKEKDPQFNDTFMDIKDEMLRLETIL